MKKAEEGDHFDWIVSGNHSARRLAIDGPLLVSNRRFGDNRGYFVETYNERDFAAIGILERFVQDNHSYSAERGTIRGLHFQIPPQAQAKLVRVVRGAVLDIVVDIRRSSSTFGKHVAVELTAHNGLQLFVPVGFAHGFCTLEPETEVAYKVTEFYNPELERSIAWDDPDLELPWPVDRNSVVLSDKDRRAPRLKEAPILFS